MSRVTYDYLDLALKVPNKTAADNKLNVFIIYFFFSEKMRVYISCESSAKLRVHVKFQVLCPLKNNLKILFKMPSSAAVIGVLSVNLFIHVDQRRNFCSVGPVEKVWNIIK